MKHKILLLCILITYSSCVDEVDLNIEEAESVVVVEGVFTDIDEIQTVKLTKSIFLGSQVEIFVPGADLKIEDNTGSQIDLLEVSEGIYQVRAKAEQGKNYRLIGTLADGRSITSNFQEVPKPFSIDTVNVIDTLAFFIDESGDRRRVRSLEFYAQSGADQIEENLRIRYSVKTVYQVGEIVCSPFITPKVCYVYNDQVPFDVNVVELNKRSDPISFETLVYRRRIDYEFGEVFALDLSLYSYNESEFDYWRKLRQIFDQSGSLTDIRPARIQGNIITDNGTEVQGQFAVVAKDRNIRFVRDSDFPTRQRPLCGIPGQRPRPLPTPCCGCLAEPGAVLEKPDYWP